MRRQILALALLRCVGARLGEPTYSYSYTEAPSAAPTTQTMTPTATIRVEIKVQAPHAIDAMVSRICSMAWRFYAIDATKFLSPYLERVRSRGSPVDFHTGNEGSDAH